MWFGQNREQIRSFFIEVWRKHRAALPLEPMEQLVAGVISEHPEYHKTLEDDHMDRDYPPEIGETNPFLHMGMHIALREQVAARHPEDITDIFRTLAERLGEAHEAEHRMMDCLAEVLWRAQRDGMNPDESSYLDCLRALKR